MVKRDITQLAVYEIGEDAETLPLECLRSLYLEKTSEIIYITKEKKLYGIICMGEVLYGRKQNAMVKINRSFTVLTEFNVIKAHEIFYEWGNINKIPVVNKHGELIGDYSRWDDELYVERMQEQVMQEKLLKRVLAPYQIVYVVEPVDKNSINYLKLLKKLKYFNISYKILDKEQIEETLSLKVALICLNEDERRGLQCLYGLVPSKYDYRGYILFRYDKLMDDQYKARIITYKSLLMQLMQEMLLDRMEIEKPSNLPIEGLDDKASVLLSALERKGIKCFCLYPFSDQKTEYGERFYERVRTRRQNSPLDFEKRMWIEKEKKEEFYSELYQLEEYKNEIVQNETNDGAYKAGYEKEIIGKYFNMQNGRRKTCFQPQKYIGTIYLFGPCIALGPFVEDQYTIASYMQRELLENGYIYRVENCGEMLRRDADIDSRIAEIGQFSVNDIVVVFSNFGKAVNIQGKSLDEIFEKNNVPCEWVTDDYRHCNHKANKVIANEVFRIVKSALSISQSKAGLSMVDADIHSIMQDYIEKKYLRSYFSDFDSEKYDKIGATVMNCNPFTCGHRYLIEQAKRQVDFLIVFVVEEDASLFPFEERFRLVQEGTKDIENVMVVPGGEFILSRNNFCEYFSKIDAKTTRRNADYDIQVFVNYIVNRLHITHRFVGEELEDNVTRAYNEAMQKILPSKGVVYVEIPRIKSGKKIVSASKVRQFMKEAEYDEAFSMLPETTVRYIKEQM